MRALDEAHQNGGVVSGGERVHERDHPDAYYVMPAIVEMSEQALLDLGDVLAGPGRRHDGEGRDFLGGKDECADVLGDLSFVDEISVEAAGLASGEHRREHVGGIPARLAEGGHAPREIGSRELHVVFQNDPPTLPIGAEIGFDGWRWFSRRKRAEPSFDPVEGSYIEGQDEQRWDLYVGVSVGSVRSGNPAEHLPWQDIQVANAPGVVEQLDFVYDPGSVPQELRVD